MNKLFKRTLALLACMTLIGQTMLTGLVTADEQQVLDTENDVVSTNDQLDVVEESNSDTLLAKEVETLGEVETLNVEGVVNNDVTDSSDFSFVTETAGDDSLNDGNDPDVCVSNSAKLGKFAQDLQGSEFLPEGVYVRAVNGKLYLYTESGRIDFNISHVTKLIDYLLGGSVSDDDGGFVWNIMGTDGYTTSISNVTQLIDIILRGGLTAPEEIVVNTRGDCFNLVIVQGLPEDLICDRDSALEDIVTRITSHIAKDLGKSDISLELSNDEIVIKHTNEGGLISYVTALIDYILVDGNVNDNSSEMLLWKNLGEKYKLDISTVTALIDLNLSDEATFYVKEKGKSCDDGRVVVKFVKSEPSSNGNAGIYETCEDPIVKGGDLKKLADLLNQKIASKGINGLSLSFDDTTLYLAVKEGTNASFNISTVTSLIDYLLTDKAEDGDRWGYIWESMKEAGFTPNISNLTELIDFNLAGGSLTPGKTIPVYSNGGCFNFKVIADNGNSNGGNNGNGYSGGGSSSGGGSNGGGGNNSNEEEIQLGGEVELGGEVADNNEGVCSIEGSTYSDEENQAYLWACEKGIVPANNIMKSKLSDPLTRAELDKMMSIYSKQLLGRSYVVNEIVSYPDVNSKLGNLVYYIQEGYKLQIMGIHANGVALNNFLPNLLVTRGEFGTVFSRVLYGSKYNIDGANYYERHLQVLKDANILTNTNPSLTEARGWVLLMLYRSQKVEESNGTISNEEIASITAEENVETVEENTTESVEENTSESVGENTENVENPTETPSEEAQN